MSGLGLGFRVRVRVRVWDLGLQVLVADLQGFTREPRGLGGAGNGYRASNVEGRSSEGFGLALHL